MTAEVVEIRRPGEQGPSVWVKVTSTSHKGWFPMEEAREIASALHRYDLAKMHEQEQG